jgi:DNA polymerase III epsilon subunit-like protein
MLIFFDVETTGLELKDRICSIGMIIDDGENIQTYYELIKPPLKKISPSASAIHHITIEMLQNAKEFKDSLTYELLQKYNNSDTTLIAHNSKFDLLMLEREGFVFQGDIIDTLKCSKYLMSDCEHHSLQFLRYETKIYKNEEKISNELNIVINAHNAISDALHVKLLFEYLKELENFEKLKDISQKKVLIEKFNFGKYKGRFIEEIVSADKAYLQWLLSVEIDEDLSYSIKKYLS